MNLSNLKKNCLSEVGPRSDQLQVGTKIFTIHALLRGSRLQETVLCYE
jgi:hypothetical protein